MSRFQIYKDAAGLYRWRLKATNGENVAGSESYAQKSSAMESAQKVKFWADSAVIEDTTKEEE